MDVLSKRLFISIILASAVFSTQAADLFENYDIQILGLEGDGQNIPVFSYVPLVTAFSGPKPLNNSGQVIGRTFFEDPITNESTKESAWFYDGVSTKQVGLIGTEYTDINGYQSSSAFALNNEGWVAGVSERYVSGTTTSHGQHAWVYHDNQTREVGLTSDEYTRSDGFEYSEAQIIVGSSHVLGSSTRFNGMNDNGYSVWAYNGIETKKLGFTGDRHTRASDGYQNSTWNDYNSQGAIIGNSDRFKTDDFSLRDFRDGTNAWIYDGNQTIALGLNGSEFEDVNGETQSRVFSINEAGQVIGESTRLNQFDAGQVAWLYDQGNYTQMGLTDAYHTSNESRQYSEILFPLNGDKKAINKNGQVIGGSEHYNLVSGAGTPDIVEHRGQSAWVYDGDKTVRLGFIGEEYTDEYGVQFSEAKMLNDQGQATGDSMRFNQQDFLGRDTWFYDGSETKQIGLVDSEHTSSQGERNSEVVDINNQGYVIGLSDRFTGEYQNDTDSWLFNGVGTIQIGLTGNEFTGTDGRQNSRVFDLNEIGQVVGLSQKYNGNEKNGQVAWFYDSNTDQTFSFDVSLRSDGFTESEIYYLDDDGLALGVYILWGQDDTYLDGRGFAFTVENGFVDLGTLLRDELGEIDLDYLKEAYLANERGQILVIGVEGEYEEKVVLLTPASNVPLPAAAWLFISSLLFLFKHKQK